MIKRQKFQIGILYGFLNFFMLFGQNLFLLIRSKRLIICDFTGGILCVE